MIILKDLEKGAFSELLKIKQEVIGRVNLNRVHPFY